MFFVKYFYTKVTQKNRHFDVHVFIVCISLSLHLETIFLLRTFSLSVSKLVQILCCVAVIVFC